MADYTYGTKPKNISSAKSIEQKEDEMAEVILLSKNESLWQMWLFSLIRMAISTIARDDNQLFDVVNVDNVVGIPRYHKGRDGFRKNSF